MKEKLEKLIIPIVMLVIGLATEATNAKLVAYWGLNELSGTTVYDSVGNNHGCLNADVAWVLGRDGKGALEFDGDGDYVDCGGGKDEGDPNTWADITSEITLAAWIRGPIGRYGAHTIVAKGNTTWRLYFWSNYSVRFCYDGLVEEEPEGLKLNVLWDDQWHHVVVTYNGAKVCLYMDGILRTSKAAYGTINTNYQPVYIGGNSEKPGREWKGLIDDVAIFDHALSEDEVTGLYKMGIASLTPDPTLQMLISAVGKAEAIIKEHRLREAIVFLEQKIAEHEQWKQENPNDSVFNHKVLSSDLNLLLAEAKEAAGVSKQEIADAYKRVIQSGAFSTLSYQSALLWLSENENTKQYEDIVRFLIQNNSDYLMMVAERAEMMVREQNLRAAVRLLEDNLAVYARWRREHPYSEVIANDQLPGMYFQLAKAKEALGVPKKDITDTYSKIFSPSYFRYVPERAAALIWLLENDSTSEYTRIIKSFMQSTDIEGLGGKIVSRVCEYFESKEKWPVFEQFLDTLFAETEHPFDWVEFIESCLNDKANRWAKAYSEYLDSKPKLKFGWDWIAEKYVADKNFRKASQRYRDIIENSALGKNKVVFDWRLCECLFSAGEYSEAASRLEDFINNYRASHGDLVKEAMLMRGHTYVKLGELGKAIEAFLTLMIEYPETENVADVNFHIGYCYMLQRKYKAAMESFDCVITNHPQSSCASKARMCITRIKRATDE